jgi:uroporphyrinogen-III decarboxylase
MGPREVIHRRALAMLRSAPRRGYIANLGHGITPEVPVAHMAEFVRTVQEFRHD